MLNKVLLEGRLAKDPVLRFLPSGKPVAEVTLANNKPYKTDEGWKEKTSFIEAKAYGSVGEAMVEKLSKGDRIVIEGELVQEIWEKDGKKVSKLRVVIDNFRILQKIEREAQETVSS